MKSIILIICLSFLGIQGAKSENLKGGELIHALNYQLTEVLVTDGFSPPAAARIYCYANIAAYECLVPYFTDYQSLAGQLTDFKGIGHVPAANVDRDFLLVCLFVDVSKDLVYRTHIMDHFKQAYLRERPDLTEEVISASQVEASRLKEEFFKWIGNDNYRRLKEADRYVPFSGPQFWEPTPPAYMDALEPNWYLLRPMVIKSPMEVVTAPPTPFDTVSSSAFYKNAMEVYDAVNTLNEERLNVAKFWDCNPLQTQTMGHFNFVSRQLTPGGHWLGIVRICSRMKNLGIMESMQAYLLVSIGMYDGFLTAWAEKYHSCLIRPETYINRYIDPNWRPILETPPFPEHPSAHSVISASSAYILTQLWGEEFSFEDDTEVNFGLTIRKFNSFNEAANEAAISRLYGGIHYMPAIEYGKETGAAIGKRVWTSLKTKG
jgi:hypothetical protein